MIASVQQFNLKVVARRSVPLSFSFLHLIITLSAVRPSAGQETLQRGVAPSTPQEVALKIGYLISGSDLDPVRPVLEELRRDLLSDSKVLSALKAGNYQDIWLRPCDAPQDMIQRLKGIEFDLAFATSVIYARQFRPRADQPDQFQEVPYEPVLQFHYLDGDVPDPKGNGVFRRGVVFIGPGSSLWSVGQPSAEQMRRELETQWLAVSDSYSAAGYIYSRLKIMDEFGEVRLRGPMFCKSGGEAFKHVVSGLTGIGACDSRILEGAAGKPAARGKFYRELFRTDPIPTDPILLRRDHLPQTSPLGRELKAAIQSFFNAAKSPVAGLRVETADRRAFELTARALEKFDRAEQEASKIPANLSASPNGARRP